ncbi:MAG TPA: M4 family metallopeptidase [Vicinamibacterales bacterium]|nr:M4 family metallopeptidase [Vicinamibacterales bacterium]
MKRVMALGAAVAALFVWLEVGVAQQASSLRFNATTANDLRSWDQFVTAQERTGTLRVSQVSRDPSLPSRTVERLQQYHQGVRVWGAEVVRDADGGVPTSIFGDVSAAFTLDTQAGLTPVAAGQTILARAPTGAVLLRPVDLVVLRLEGGEHRLTYTSVVSGGNRVDRVFVDARSGAELLRYSSIHKQAAIGSGQGMVGGTKKVSARLQGGVYLADDDLRPPVLTTFDMRGNLGRALNVWLAGAPLFTSDIGSDSDNTWTDIPTIDAHAYLGWTYDYYFKRHGRRGLDNADRPLVSLVNPLSQQGALSLPIELIDYAINAFWCDYCGPGAVGMMYFGNGIPSNTTFAGYSINSLAGSIDVVAHELTHGVTSSSSNLIYMNESGALNEAFSDIMGTAVEFFYQPVGAGLGQADYLIGEDSVRVPSLGRNGFRSMVNPASYGYPDHYSIRYTGSEDEGGVHINSSIANHAFYLAIEGGRHRLSGVTVQGVGSANREQIEKAFYRAFVFLLPASANFSMARATTIQAARDLYGANSAAATAITQAWTAVGVN